ncbi:phage baseplate assembly protein V [Ferrovibrio terrae]|uniref:phage baseplate assembly protein V n=1 Tax=Ferrovibrio terrae TaxID=2594003 RepID=UPI0031384895
MSKRLFDAAMRPTVNRVKLAIGRAVLRLVSDAGVLQRLQIEGLKDELFWADRIQNYGFYSNPPPGADVAVVFQGGDRGAGVAVGVDHRDYRPKNLKTGEAMMADMFGKFIYMQDDGTIVIKATKIRLEAAMVEGTGEIKDRCDSDGKTMSGMRASHNTHKHPENGGAGPTDVPTEPM